MENEKNAANADAGYLEQRNREFREIWERVLRSLPREDVMEMNELRNAGKLNHTEIQRILGREENEKKVIEALSREHDDSNGEHDSTQSEHDDSNGEHDSTQSEHAEKSEEHAGENDELNDSLPSQGGIDEKMIEEFTNEAKEAQ